MTKDAFLMKLAEILEVKAEDLNEQFKLDYKNWDSLRVMATIAAIDQYFDILVSPEQLEACSSAKDLFELIKRQPG
jgi:acyl carrier protein